MTAIRDATQAALLCAGVVLIAHGVGESGWLVALGAGLLGIYVAWSNRGGAA